MEHYKESQYDDDLTVGINDYDEDFSSSGVDLFDFIGDEESPMASLKSIILSIDWEITDDILRQFNEELVNLKGTWRNEKINLVYIQALEKISRYIYKEKASAHPNAIKLLLTFYTNLEKIVSEQTLSDNEKKAILFEDVKRFEKFKKQILPGAKEPQKEKVVKTAEVETTSPEPEIPVVPETDKKVLLTDVLDSGDPLLNLKAIVYGIDWEITERELNNLAIEVAKLEQKYSGSKPKLIFLQGIGSLGTYISMKKSDAHADAFTLLHSFYAGLEKVIVNDLSGEAEKNILLPEVEKFNDFKKLVERTIANQSSEEAEEEEEIYEGGEIQPAFADMPEDVHGFRADEEELKEITQSKAVFDDAIEADLESEDDSELANEMESRLEGMFDEPGKESVKGIDADIALAGVNVETDADDDSDEEPLLFEGDELAPALSTEEDLGGFNEAPAELPDDIEDSDFKEADIDAVAFESDIDEDSLSDEVEEEISDLIDPALAAGEDDKDLSSIPGVDVETEADDDSDEDPLPLENGELAPALFDGDDFEDFDTAQTAIEKSDEIDSNIEEFFSESDDEALIEPESVTDTEDDLLAVDDGETETSVEDEPELEAEPELEFELQPETEMDSSEDLEEETPALEDTVENIVDEDLAISDVADEIEGDLEDFFAETDDLSGETDLEAAEDIQHVEQGEDTEEHAEEGEAVTETSTSEEIADEEVEDVIDADVDEKLTSFFGESESPISSDENLALSGVDVEREDDDDSEEMPLPMDGDELAPALDGIVAAGEESEMEPPLLGGDGDEVETALFGSDDLEEDTFSVAGDDELGEAGEDELEGPSLFDERGSEESEDLSFTDEELDEEVDEDLMPALSEALSEEDMSTLDEEDDDLDQLSDDLMQALDDSDEEEQIAFAAVTEMPGDEIGENLDVEIETLADEDLVAVGNENDYLPSDLDSGNDVLAMLESDEGVENQEQLVAGFAEAEEVVFTAADEEDEPLEELRIVEVDGNVIDAELENLLLEDTLETDDDQSESSLVLGSEELLSDSLSDSSDAIMAEEEEVIFVAADDEDDLSPVQNAGVDFDDSQIFSTTLLHEGPIAGEAALDEDEEQFLLGQKLDELPEDELLEKALAEQGEHVDSAYVISPDTGYEDQHAGDILSGLRDAIAEIESDIDEDAIEKLNSEVSALRDICRNPLEKTYIQLLTTISDHIEKYSIGSDRESVNLLHSVFDKLELSLMEPGDNAAKQETLLAETSKVLQWQQRLIYRNPEPINSEISSGSAGSEDGLLGTAIDSEEQSVDMAIESMSEKVNALGDDLLMQKVSSVMKSELEELKLAFQEEIQRLREEILKGKE